MNTKVLNYIFFLFVFCRKSEMIYRFSLIMRVMLKLHTIIADNGFSYIVVLWYISLI